MRSYEQAISIQPRYALAHNNRANVFFRQKDYDKAISGYDDADPPRTAQRDALCQSRQRLPR